MNDKKTKKVRDPVTFMRELQEKYTIATKRLEDEKQEHFNTAVQNILDEVLEAAEQAAETRGVKEYRREFYVGYGCGLITMNLELIEAVAGRLTKEYGFLTYAAAKEVAGEKTILLSFTWEGRKIEEAERMEYDERMEMAND